MVLAEADARADAAQIEVPEIAWGKLQEYRMRRYRRYAEGKVKTEEQARQFIDELGFMFLFPAPGVEMPSLWDAINGRERDIPGHHHDHALSLTWDWKDSMPAKKWVWYGKLLRGKPMFIALDLLPAFYALSENYGELDDYLQQYEDGKLSVEARQVYEALLEHGANSTNAIRKLSGMVGKGDAAKRFDRAITELQIDMKIVKCGVSNDNRWKYCYVYDLLLRRHPEIAEQARAITTREARRIILLRYLHNVGAAPAAVLPSLLGWDPELTRRTIAELLTAAELREARLTGMPAKGAKTGTGKGKVAAGDVLLIDQGLVQGSAG